MGARSRVLSNTRRSKMVGSVSQDHGDLPGLDSSSRDVFDRLMSEVHQRARDLPENSYTTQLLSGGISKMGAKIVEEAAEVVDAANTSTAPDNSHLIYEACDLIYHLWVLLGSRGVQVDDLRRELSRRAGTSGLEEKRNRQ